MNISTCEDIEREKIHLLRNIKTDTHANNGVKISLLMLIFVRKDKIERARKQASKLMETCASA